VWDVENKKEEKRRAGALFEFPLTKKVSRERERDRFPRVAQNIIFPFLLVAQISRKRPEKEQNRVKV
jgi:hypothetical protein